MQYLLCKQDLPGFASLLTRLAPLPQQFHDGGAVKVNVPEGHTVAIVVQRGSVTIDGNAMKPVDLALFERESGQIEMRALPESRALILTGEPLGEPIAGQGPFVMNTREEIIQAIEDYQSGKMGTLAQ